MIFFSEPFPAKCADRKALPKYHPQSASPQDWFSNQITEKHNCYGLSFDFFANWSATPPELSPVVWIKKVLLPEFRYEQVLRHLNAVMLLELGKTYLHQLTALSLNLKLQIQFIIFRDDSDWNSKQTGILLVTLNGKVKNNFDFTGEFISITDFKTKIRSFSGGPVQMGTKGLTYGTSNLECYLSKTTSLYPGDADLLLFNKLHLPFAILEYKKHTLKSAVANQQLSNYYPKPDGRKYDRLAILRDFLSDHFKTQIPIIVIYFPTRNGTKEGVMEIIHGPPGKLESITALNFKLPVVHNTTEYDAVMRALLGAIDWYKTLV